MAIIQQTKPLKVLLVEDSEDDAELMRLRLDRGGYKLHCERVQTAPSMKEALEREPWDIVISDYVMPEFTGLAALKVLQKHGSDIPFIIVSGHIGEDTAVAAMKAGAHDYLMKDNLTRLIPAIERELAEAQVRRERRRSEEELRKEHTFRETIEASIPSGISVVDLHGQQTYVNPAFCAMLGWSEAELIGTRAPFVYWPSEDLPALTKLFSEIISGKGPEQAIEVRLRRRNDERFPALVHVKPLVGHGGKVTGWLRSVTDITELKRAEEALRQAHDQLEIRVQRRTADLAAALTKLRDAAQARKRLEHELLEITERERRRIGVELHDDLGQQLTGIAFMLKSLELNLKKKKVTEATSAGKIHSLFTAAMNHAKDVARHLTALNVQEENLSDALKRMAAQVRTMFKISCSFRSQGNILPQPETIVQQLHKIAQEAITNAIRHGKARKVQVNLNGLDGKIVLAIRNDGVPFPSMSEQRPGVGLRIMNYRANLIGATLEVKGSRGGGTVVLCTLRTGADGKAKSGDTDYIFKPLQKI